MPPTVRRRLGRLFGRVAPPVRCEVCGAVLFRGVPIVSHGQVKLPGAEDALVRVDFETTSRLGFRHVEQAACTGARPT